MDRRPDLTTAARLADPPSAPLAPHTADSVPVEHAIFTSTRSHTGEGYRFIASSPGVRPEDKRLLLPRMPSDGGLCDPEPAAQALAFFGVGERLCLAWSLYAGREHTARGGQRVFTRVALLHPKDSWAFDHDPFRIRDALEDAVGAQPDLAPDPRPEALELTARAARGAGPISPADGARAAMLLDALCDQRASVCASPLDRETLVRAAWRAVPMRRRAAITFSLGWQWSRARDVHVTLAREPLSERRQTQAQGARMLTWDEPVLCCPADFLPWRQLALRLWSSERWDELARLAQGVDRDASFAALTAIAALHRDLPAALGADEARLARIERSHLSAPPANRSAVELQQRLRDAIAARRAELAEIAEREQAARENEAERIQASSAGG